MMEKKNRNNKKVLRCAAFVLSAALTWQVAAPSMTSFVTAMSEADDRLSRIYEILSENVGTPETAEDYYEMANISIGQGEYETALEHLLTAQLLIVGEQTEETLEQTDEQKEQTKVENTNTEMQINATAVENLSEDERALLADVCLKIASVYILTDKLDAAQTALDDVLLIDPDAAQALMLRAQLNIEKMDYAAAVADMQAYLALNPTDISNRQTLAQLLEATEDYEGAIAQYQALYEQTPEDESFNLNALRCMFLCGRYEEAIAGFDDYKLRTAETGDSFGGVADFLRAACLMQMGDYAAAAQGFETAIEAGYEKSYCLEQITLCCYENGEYEKVLSAGNELLAMENAAVSAPELVYQRMGISSMRLGDYESALASMDKASELNPTLEGNDYYRGVCLLSLQRPSEAVEAFTASIESNYLLQFCYYNRGVCYVDLLEYDKAIDDMAMTLASGDDEELNEAAKNILWQFAEYFDQLNETEKTTSTADETLEETAQ